MAELKLKPEHPTLPEYAVFEFTLKKKIPISHMEDSIKDSDTIKINGDFKGSTDEDLAGWISSIIKEWHSSDPLQFIGDWELTWDAKLTKFDVKLER